MTIPGDRLREREDAAGVEYLPPSMPTPLAAASAAGPAASRGTTARSILAIGAALLANAALSLGVDQLLHTFAVYPPWGEPMLAPELNVLALSYRLAFGVGAGWLVARLAPRAPIGHAVLLGVVATILSTIGAAGALTRGNLGPAWYPIVLAILAYPSVRLGAEVHERARIPRLGQG